MTPSERVDDYLHQLRVQDPDRHALLARLRKLILAQGPKVSEDIRYGGMLFSAGAPFCGVYSYPRHVALEFSRGAALADAHQVLEGEGAKRRHIKLETGGDLFRKHVREYIALAVAAAQATKSRARPVP